MTSSAYQAVRFRLPLVQRVLEFLHLAAEKLELLVIVLVLVLLLEIRDVVFLRLDFLLQIFDILLQLKRMLNNDR